MIECIAATENKCENLDQLTKQLTQRRRDLNLDAVDFTLIDPTFHSNDKIAAPFLHRAKGTKIELIAALEC